MEYFSMIAKWLSNKAGQPITCIIAVLLIVGWGFLGPVMHFNDAWQLIINTFSSIVSIIMLFIIQNSQNRHTVAIQLKLDEIIRATKGAHNEMMDIEKRTDEEMAVIEKKYSLLAEQTKEDLQKGKLDTHTPDVTKINIEKEDK